MYPLSFQVAAPDWCPERIKGMKKSFLFRDSRIPHGSVAGYTVCCGCYSDDGAALVAYSRAAAAAGQEALRQLSKWKRMFRSVEGVHLEGNFELLVMWLKQEGRNYLNCGACPHPCPPLLSPRRTVELLRRVWRKWVAEEQLCPA